MSNTMLKNDWTESPWEMKTVNTSNPGSAEPQLGKGDGMMHDAELGLGVPGKSISVGTAIRSALTGCSTEGLFVNRAVAPSTVNDEEPIIVTSNFR